MRPHDPWPAAQLVRALAAQNRVRKALAMARALAERLPDHLDAHLLVAWTEERSGRIGRAIEALGRAQHAFSQAFLPAVCLAELLARHGRIAQASEVVEEAIKIHPDTLSLRLAQIDLGFAAGQPVAEQIEALFADYPAHREVNKRVARLEVGAARFAVARRLWAGVARLDRRVSGPPLHLERLDDRPIPLPDGAGDPRHRQRLRRWLA
jgi:tetratricopeptide (TPR) repeat protein